MIGRTREIEWNVIARTDKKHDTARFHALPEEIEKFAGSGDVFENVAAEHYIELIAQFR